MSSPRRVVEFLTGRFGARFVANLGFLRGAASAALGVRVLALDPQGRIFLVRHTYISGWYLPGGGVDRHESAAMAAIRELREEGDIILTEPVTLFGLYLSASGRGRRHVALYVAHNAQQAAPKLPDHEIAESGFYALSALPQGVTRATQARIAEVLAGAPRSQVW